MIQIYIYFLRDIDINKCVFKLFVYLTKKKRKMLNKCLMFYGNIPKCILLKCLCVKNFV